MDVDERAGHMDSDAWASYSENQFVPMPASPELLEDEFYAQQLAASFEEVRISLPPSYRPTPIHYCDDQCGRTTSLRTR